MRSGPFRALFLGLFLSSLGLLACDLSTFGLAQAQKPQVTIQSPASGSAFREGDEIAIQSTSTDPAGIIRVDLAVDGTIVQTDAPPVAQGQISFPVVQRWKAMAGSHTLSVRAYNASNAASDPALVSVTVTSATAATDVPPTAVGPATLPPVGTLPTLAPSEATPNVTATRVPPTRVPPTPTIKAPPGVYALSIRVVQNPPKRGADVTFQVTFLNTMGTPQHFDWVVMPFAPDARNAKGETYKKADDIPVGTSVLTSAEGWRIAGPGPCEEYNARVFYVDPNNKANRVEFIKPDGSGGPVTNFQVCP